MKRHWYHTNFKLLLYPLIVTIACCVARSQENKRSDENDTLPYAQGKAVEEVEHYPQFGVSFGGAWYSANYTPVNDAFNRLSSQYAAKGYYNIPVASFKAPALYFPSVGFRVSPHVLLMLEGTTSFFADVTINAISASATYRFYDKKILGASPFVRVGIGYFHLDISQSNTIDSTDSVGVLSHDFKDSVAGGNFGGMGGVGLEFDLSTNITFDLHADYLFVPALKGTASDGVAIRENLSGFLIGARFKCFFM